VCGYAHLTFAVEASRVVLQCTWKVVGGGGRVEDVWCYHHSTVGATAPVIRTRQASKWEAIIVSFRSAWRNC
jgi:hypothetical protein